MPLRETILDTVGDTSAVRINRLAPDGVEPFVKLDMFNPPGSVKDSLAMVCAVEGDPLVATRAESFPVERRRLMGAGRPIPRLPRKGQRAPPTDCSIKSAAAGARDASRISVPDAPNLPSNPPPRGRFLICRCHPRVAGSIPALGTTLCQYFQ